MMTSETDRGLKTDGVSKVNPPNNTKNLFTIDYVDFLKEAGWKLEKNMPSMNNNYSDLLEDTEWKSNKSELKRLKHYRRDLDSLS